MRNFAFDLDNGRGVMEVCFICLTACSHSRCLQLRYFQANDRDILTKVHCHKALFCDLAPVQTLLSGVCADVLDALWPSHMHTPRVTLTERTLMVQCTPDESRTLQVHLNVCSAQHKRLLWLGWRMQCWPVFTHMARS